MSAENVELVRSLHPPLATDLAQNFRDDHRWGVVSAVLTRALASDVKVSARGYLEADHETFEGLAGLRYLWLEWLTPWASYRTEVEDMLDLGDDVLVLVRDFGRRTGDTGEVAVASAAIWRVQDGKIVQITFFADRATALQAVGLAE